MHRTPPELLVEAGDEDQADKTTVMHMAKRYGGRYMGVARINRLRGRGHYWVFPDSGQAAAFVDEFKDEFDNLPDEVAVFWPAQRGTAAGAAIGADYLG